jgi:hypothetical protein
MTPFARLAHNLTVLQNSIRFDWADLEAVNLSHDELDRAREHVRAAQESLAELAVRLDRRIGRPAA